MDLGRKEFNKNKIVIPVIILIILTAAYVADSLSKAMRPMTVEEYESRYAIPEFPKPIVQK